MWTRLCLGVVLCSSVWAQDDAAAIARSRIGEAVGAEPRVSEFNPAALTRLTGGAVIFSAVPAPFGIPELRRGGVAVVQRFDALGAAITMTGLSAGSSKCIGARLSIGSRWNADISTGFDCRITHWNFPRYTSRTELLAGIGLEITSGPALTGAVIRWKAQEGRSASVQDISAGIGCRIEAGDDVVLFAECLQEALVPITVRCALSVRPFENFTLVCSWAENPGSIGAGIEWSSPMWGMQFGAQWHSLLGWTQALDVRFSWK